jgi:fumarylacetoacetase
VSGHRNDPTLDPTLRSWVPVPEGSDFPIQNLPFGVFRCPGLRPRVGVAIGDHVLDLEAVMASGLFADLEVALPAGVFGSDSLNGLLALGRPAWRSVRRRVSELLRAGSSEILERTGPEGRVLARQAEVELLLPARIGDYVDFYSSIEHATNMGRLFRPDTEPLLPNWRRMPVGYHGRAGSIAVTGTPVVRPRGQWKEGGGGEPSWAPTRMLDVELEVGFITGPGSRQGGRISIDRAEQHIFGLVLVNDWSARDIQAFEYQPLGPFLGKSFATSISPWVVTLDALEPYRLPGPPQDPPAMGYLSTPEDWAFDIELAIELQSGAMANAGLSPMPISRANFRGLYWSIAQQLAHASSNGAVVRPGDLFASGTISGPAPGSFGSLIELTWRGANPISLPDGAMRTFLEDGDTVVLRGRCTGPGRAPIGFGECRGTVVPAPID